MAIPEHFVMALTSDVGQLMQGRSEVLEHPKAIGQLRSTSLGAPPGTASARRIHDALGRAADSLTPDYRRQAARILLGLDHTRGLSFSKRVDELERIYRGAAAGEGPERPTRRHRQVLLRAEVPDLRAAVVQALLEIEADFTKAQRSEGRRHVLDRTVKVMTWEAYDERVQRLAKELGTMRAEVDPSDPASDSWAIIGVSRGGLPLAVHLSHLLGCRVFGSVSLWKYRKGEEDAASVIDGLYTPPRDANGNPNTLLVVDDVIASGRGVEVVSRVLRRRYGTPPVRIIEASLLRDVNRTPLTRNSVTAEEYDSFKYWWSLPWEAAHPDHVGPQPSTPGRLATH